MRQSKLCEGGLLGCCLNQEPEQALIAFALLNELTFLTQTFNKQNILISNLNEDISQVIVYIESQIPQMYIFASVATIYVGVGQNIFLVYFQNVPKNNAGFCTLVFSCSMQRNIKIFSSMLRNECPPV